MPYSSEDLLRCLVPLKLVIIGENPGPEHHAIRTAIHRAFHGGHYSADSSEAYFAAGEDLGVSVLEADLANGPDLAKQIIANARASALHALVVAVIHDIAPVSEKIFCPGSSSTARVCWMLPRMW